MPAYFVMRKLIYFISVGAFNEQSALRKSGTIESKLIDHYVPFLPLEEKHVIECIKDTFQHWGISDPLKEIIQKLTNSGD